MKNDGIVRLKLWVVEKEAMAGTRGSNGETVVLEMF